ncbi:MAG: hypothetical protein ACOX7R_02600 [Acetivibrionales bacterium]
MDNMANYYYASLTKEQEEILKKAEEQINAQAESPILIMAFKGDKR